MRTSAPAWQLLLAFVLSLATLCGLIVWLQNVHMVTANGMYKSIQAEPWIADPATARLIGDVFGIGELALEDAVTPDERPKVELFGHQVLIAARTLPLGLAADDLQAHGESRAGQSHGDRRSWLTGDVRNGREGAEFRGCGRCFRR